jgi:hypothetical protein
MIGLFRCFSAGLFGLTCLLVPSLADAPQGEPERFTLRYKFQPGETIRFSVLHRTKVRTTVSGTTQTVETTSASVKVWRVLEVKPDGSATFEHLVEDVDMRQEVTGRAEVHYNSRTDKKPPPGFDDLARAVGVPLSKVTLDAHGKVLRREHKPLAAAVPSEGDITLLLPDEPVPVGHTWSFPHEVSVAGRNGGIVKVKTVKKLTLTSVKTGVATIEVATRILTPIHDAAIESQLLQCESAGTVRFDIDDGRTLSQQMDLDKHVVGFRGDASSVHYVNRFTEELLPPENRTASLPAAKKATPPR